VFLLIVVLLRPWLVSLAVARGAYVVMEQPINSLLYKWPPVAALTDHIPLRREVTASGAFGGASVKQLEFRTNIPKDVFDRYMVRTRKQAWARLKQNSQHEVKLTKKAGLKKKWVCGTAAMKASAAYPAEMCQSIADMVVALQ
jgi:hypothetical protein